MPSKKRKYNARFPAGRIKRIMQADEEVGKIAHAVPVIISRTLELFVESLLTKSSQITLSRNAKTLSPTHLKQCIMSESRFDFLKDLVKNVPDIESGQANDIEPHQYNSGNNNNIALEHQQQAVPVTYNGMDANGSSTSSSRPYQRSQSHQPSTSTGGNSQIQQYHNPIVQQQKQFYLNNYTSVTSSSNQNTIPNTNNTEYHPPAKIVRINSTPSSTITSEQHQQKQQQSHQIQIQQQNKQSLPPLEFPIKISYNIDGSATSTESPTVKIDYSKLSLPATSPSIKIDLSNFNPQQVTTAPIQPSTNVSAAASAAALDEDYDA